MMADDTAPTAKLIAIPIKISCNLPPPITCDKIKMSPATITAVINAAIHNIQMLGSGINKLTSIAPNNAPELMPIVDGDAKSLPKVTCTTVPDCANNAPLNTAINSVGNNS